ncbi:MAG: D-2-hydroxyacid dehydrogenase [Campylobacter sp.]|nr:D-2-hydroxyacid dehydrogenase [Campylobacter sp.]
MKLVFLDAGTLGNDISLDIFKEFGEFIAYEETRQDEVIQRLKDADVAMTNKVLITKEIIANTNIKLICVSATGTNNIDMQAAKEAGIPVKNVAGYSTNSVSEQTFANLFALKRQIEFCNEFCQSGNWKKLDILQKIPRSITEIYGKKFGIIGLGDIGRNVAKIATAFGCEVVYYSTSGKNSNNDYQRVSLEELLKTCDIISVHAPLNENTKNLIAKEQILLLKDGVYLMNFGRGGIINEEDIAKAIDEREIYFTTDVLETEPMKPNHPFLSIKNKHNILITPHTAWGSIEARKELLKQMVKNIRDTLL